jgi:endonuclease YncB( thermonuclease family)
MGATSAGANDGCRGDALARASVRAIVDGRTLALDDGRQVRLAGIEIPPSPGPAGAEDSPEAQATRYLRSILAAGPVLLSTSEEGPDRYGRMRAYVFAESEPLEGSIQHVMVARGLAVVAARVDARACAAGLKDAEGQARTARRGLWADGAAVLRADDSAGILARRGRFALVEGHVLSVRASGGTIYVNFGRRWSEDFTVTIAKRNERRLAADGLDSKRLERRTVRVRGFVEERGGPWIEVTDAGQVEIVSR